MSGFSYEVDKDFDFVVDEKNNSFIALRKVKWGEKGVSKLDIRKWYIGEDGEEIVGKGVSFLTDEGPNELTKVLVEQGYGDTKTLLEILEKRDDVDKEEVLYDSSDILK